ncbi:MAG: DNA cytosine methyltransferase [Kofleriaceae bacterium]
MRSLRVCSLFSGIGGIELGLGSAGHRVNLFCERDESARKVLASRFDDVDIHDDVTKLDALPEDTELLAAGFPCQDISQAGLVRGLAGKNSQLVEHVFRLISARKPAFVLLENVAFLLRAQRGRVLSEILEQFETLGYRWAYRVLDSQAFGVPQRRERVFILASLEEDPRRILFAGNKSAPEPFAKTKSKRSVGFYWSEGNHGFGWAIESIPPLKSGSSAGGALPPAILLPTDEVIKPDIRDAERLQGFRAGWTKEARSERDRWRLVGNAVTVPVAKWLGGMLANPTDVYWDSTTLAAGASWPRAAYNVHGVRRTSDLSSYPIWKPRKRIAEFLNHEGAALSVRATSGFLSRARASSLDVPSDLLARIELHLTRQQSSTS